MSNLGFGEIALLLFVAFLIFGPSKLPKLGRAAGQALKEFKNGMNGIINEEVKDKDDRK
jgi:sec-independent protein translocase protein TatA